MKITEEEYLAILEELKQRAADLWFMKPIQSLERVEGMENLSKEFIEEKLDDEKSEIAIIYTVITTGMDLRQILGRIRRIQASKIECSNCKSNVIPIKLQSEDFTRCPKCGKHLQET